MNPIPSRLFKYLDGSGAKAFLEKPQIRFKDWRKLDDSMEILPGFRALTETEIKHHAAAKYQQCQGKIPLEKCEIFVRSNSKLDSLYLEKEMRKFFNESEATLFVNSMSVRPDSGALWAHYAENHKGLVFGLGKVLPKLTEQHGLTFREITYSKARPQTGFPVLDMNALEQSIHTKCEDWCYQGEWRMLNYNDAPIFIVPAEVDDVIVGFNASQEILTLAIAMKQHGVSVSQDYPDPKLHKVSFKPL
jgi:hypothetical protein